MTRSTPHSSRFGSHIRPLRPDFPTSARTSRSWRFLAGLCGLIAVTSTGCSLPHRVGVAEDGQLQYDQLELVYDLHSTRLTEMGGGVRPASGTSEFDGSWPFARLRVEYPHPQQRPGYARAQLRLGRAPIVAQEKSWTQRFRSGLGRLTGGDDQADESDQNLDDEIWVLDLPKEEVDKLVQQLASRGYFNDQTRPSGDADLHVQIDRGTTQKRWTAEPRLDGLIERVYQDGWLAGLVSCQESGILQTGWSL